MLNMIQETMSVSDPCHPLMVTCAHPEIFTIKYLVTIEHNFLVIFCLKSILKCGTI